MIKHTNLAYLKYIGYLDGSNLIGFSAFLRILWGGKRKKKKVEEILLFSVHFLFCGFVVFCLFGVKARAWSSKFLWQQKCFLRRESYCSAEENKSLF